MDRQNERVKDRWRSGKDGRESVSWFVCCATGHWDVAAQTGHWGVAAWPVTGAVLFQT